jgi:hypothetical protein
MSDFCSVRIFKYFHGEFWAPSFNSFLRRSDVGVALVTPPSMLEIVWISLTVNDMWEYLRDVTLGTVQFCNMQDQQPRLPRGVVSLICEFFLAQLDLGRVLSFHWKNVLQNWICILLAERSAVRTDDICERYHLSSNFTTFGQWRALLRRCVNSKLSH